MFKSTNDFFDSVKTGNVTQIDIEEYVYKKTKKHNLDKLKTFVNDIEFYLFAEKDFLIGDITEKDWEEKHKYYKDQGLETPLTKRENLIKKSNEGIGLNVTNEPDFYYSYDVENLFYPFEFFCIYELEKYVTKLINDFSIQNTNLKHENIFCNNGFVLFEYILKEYVRQAKGRQTDLLFYYWKMYNNEPQYIHQRPTDFFIWFDKEYSEISGQLKTYHNVKTPQKEKDFSNALDWFKLQNS